MCLPGVPSSTNHRLQLLYHIHLLSLSPFLPQVSSHLATLFSLSTPSHRAQYLLARHERSTLSHSIKYAICDLGVVRALERIAQGRGKRLRCAELPRRLVQGLARAEDGVAADGEAREGSTAVDLPLLRYLLERYEASPNSKKGYFLARAVFARHIPLIRLLLAHGADPALKGGWAVTTAIGFGDLDLVKMLLEREVERDDVPDEVELEGWNARKRRGSGGGGGGKRRKMEERCVATTEMLEVAIKGQQWDIATYLMAKGAPSSCCACQCERVAHPLVHQEHYRASMPSRCCER